MSCFQTILVPIDFSDPSRVALAMAIGLARPARSHVHLLHAYELPLTTISPYGVPMSEPLLAEARKVAEGQLERCAEEVREAGLACQTHLRYGSPATTISEEARTLSANLIVMSTHGHTGLKHALLGSVAERTVRHAPCPVLTLRAAQAPSARFRRILVPHDFSPHADAALELAIALAREHGAALHLLHSCELPAAVTSAYGITMPQALWDGVQEAAAEGLERSMKQVKAAGLEGQSHLAADRAEGAIFATAEHVRADLIVMGTRGLTGLQHVLLGSVAERVLRAAPCPVLTAKSPG